MYVNAGSQHRLVIELKRWLSQQFAPMVVQSENHCPAADRQSDAVIGASDCVCVREPGKRPRYLPDDGPGGSFKFEVLARRLVER